MEKNKLAAVGLGVLGAGVIVLSMLPCRGTTRTENATEIVYSSCVPGYGRVYFIDKKANGKGFDAYELPRLSGDGLPNPEFSMADAPALIREAAKTVEINYTLQKNKER